LGSIDKQESKIKEATKAAKDIKELPPEQTTALNQVSTKIDESQAITQELKISCVNPLKAMLSALIGNVERASEQLEKLEKLQETVDKMQHRNVNIKISNANTIASVNTNASPTQSKTNDRGVA
jgi:hypothetical protein